MTLFCRSVLALAISATVVSAQSQPATSSQPSSSSKPASQATTPPGGERPSVTPPAPAVPTENPAQPDAPAKPVSPAPAQPGAKPAQPKTPLPLPGAPSVPLRPGLVGEYFKGAKDFPSRVSSLGKPFYVRTEPSVYYKRVKGQFYGTKLSDDFAARWNGFLKVDKAGRYTFNLKSDDASRLVLSGVQLTEVRETSDIQGFKGRDVTVELRAGLYPLLIEYQEGAVDAGCMLTWKAPGSDKLGRIPEEALVHAAEQEQVAWDKDAWKATPAPAREGSANYAEMDYGRFLSATYDGGEKNATLKGVLIKLNKEGTANVVFDTELLRYSMGWTGGFIDFKGVAFDGAHGTNPGPASDATVVFATQQEPGAIASAVGVPSALPLKDPREVPFGPLPRSQGHYKGLHLAGDQVVVSYSVGGCDVLDLPGLEQVGQTPVFTRTVQLAPTRTPVTFLITGGEKFRDDALRTSVAYPPEAKLTRAEGNRRYLTFPASTTTKTYKIAIAAAAVPAEELRRIADAPATDPASLTRGGKAHWAPVVTKGAVGTGDGAYVVDTITVPEENPYKSWMRIAGLDFFSDGRAAVCTWSGDVWVVSGIDEKLDHVTWKRYATGLFQPLGLKIVDDRIYVNGRDQITRLYDFNGDGEADFYENFNNDCEVSSSFHEFTFDLQTDSKGNFYYVKAGPVRPGGRGWQTITHDNGTMMRVSKDGKKHEVFAVGLRAPNGMSIAPDDRITVADNEGTWTPACRLSLVHPGMHLGVVDLYHEANPQKIYDNPICWFPHGDVDNSSGGQAWVTSDAWGPFKDQMLHLSYGQCSLFKVFYEQVDGTIQGGVVRFPLNFVSGICRARFNPIDQQLYVAGLRGWQTTATKDAGFQRVRYTGKRVDMPTDLHVKKDGVELHFTTPVDSKLAADPESYTIEQWNYIWSSEYGSPEVSTTDPNKKGHDDVMVESATVSPDGKTVTLKLDGVKPVMQMKIAMKLKTADGQPLNYTIYNTINKVPGSKATNTAGASAKSPQAAGN
jgi:hypothetical protein